jgi:hypothetical protein
MWKDAMGGFRNCQPGTAGTTREQCFKYAAIHEFGHVLGYAHEQNRSDLPAGVTDCAHVGNPGNTTFGPWDFWSVMNYCSTSATTYASRGLLTPYDTFGTTVKYGAGPSPLFFYKTGSPNGVAAAATLSPIGAYAGGNPINDALAGNFTHAVGDKNYTVLLYKQSTGTGKTAKIDQFGNFTLLKDVAVGTGWTHLTSLQNGFVFFYRQDKGVGRVGRIDAKGTFTSFGNQITGFSTDWTHVVGLTNGTLFFLKASDGTAYLSRINPQGQYISDREINVGTGWTHVASVHHNVLLLLNNTTHTAKAMTIANSVIDAPGATNPGQIDFFLNSPIPNIPNTTHLAGARNGALLFFDKATGQGTPASVNVGGTVFTKGQTISGFSAWDQVVGL